VTENLSCVRCIHPVYPEEQEICNKNNAPEAEKIGMKKIRGKRKKHLLFSTNDGMIIQSRLSIEGGATMPNIKSAKKRVKVIKVKTLNNKAFNSALKTDIKKADAAISAKADNRAEVVRLAVKKIDQAAAKGILHPNAAARKKSALVRKLNAEA
jgi:small subunit ribosomal protein S20